MNRATLTDKQWESILLFLLACPRVRVGKRDACRAFLNAALWILRSDAQWRFMPAEVGRWNTVFKRFARWFALTPVRRAHEGARRKMRHWGVRAGDSSTKIHAVTDALGNPLDFILTGGQAADISQANDLLANVAAEAVLADKGYDADALVKPLTERHIRVVIPPRANRVEPRTCDWHLYKERHLIECFFNKIKQHYRRVFSRFEKTARNFMGFLQFTAVLIWTR